MHCGLSATSAYDAVMKAISASINEAAVGQCLREIEDTGVDVTERYDGSGTSTLQLNRWPIYSVTSVYIDGDRLFPANSLVAATDYDFYPKTGLLELLPGGGGAMGVAGTFPLARLAVKVTYRGGYSVASPGNSIPEDLKMAATLWGVAVFNRRRDEGMLQTVRGTETDGFLTAAMPKVAREIFSRYKPGYLATGGHA